jgi:hypothetical protein
MITLFIWAFERKTNPTICVLILKNTPTNTHKNKGETDAKSSLASINII